MDPRVPYEEQSREALMWIRTPFLEPDHWPFPFLVVHGHTVEGPVADPPVRAHRIGIDTGAVISGTLTAVEFWGARLRFVTVESR